MEIHAAKIKRISDKKLLLEWKEEVSRDLEAFSQEMYSCTPIQSHPDFFRLNAQRTKLKKWLIRINERLIELESEPPYSSYYEDFVRFIRRIDKDLYFELNNRYISEKCVQNK